MTDVNHLQEAKDFTNMSRSWTEGESAYDPFIIEVAKVDALIAIAESQRNINVLLKTLLTVHDEDLGKIAEQLEKMNEPKSYLARLLGSGSYEILEDK